MTSLRDAGKQQRRERILKAAEKLIRTRGEVDFSMRELAKEAGVAFVTPFNLFGSKADVLYSLMEVALESQRAQLIADDEQEGPIEKIFGLALRAQHSYTSDAKLTRPVLSALMNVQNASAHKELLELTLELWTMPLRDAARAKILIPGRDIEFLACSLHVMFRGAISLWVAGDLSDAELEAQTEHGVAVVLLGALKASERDAIFERLQNMTKRSATRNLAAGC